MLTLFPKMLRSFALCITMLLCVVTARATSMPPVLVGLDGEFGVENSISAQAIELGLRTGAGPAHGDRANQCGRRRAGRASD